jgi:hypothetical protein
MAFLGSHNVDFSDTKQNIVKIIGTSLCKYQFENLQFFIDYEQASFEDSEQLKTVHKNDLWQLSDFSLDGILGIKDKRKVFAVIGPYGLMLRISNTYIEFMTPIFNRPDWYSLANTKAVTQWRKYFKHIVTLLGGSEALYITQAYFGKYHDFFRDLNISFSEKIETINKRPGVSKKLFTDYGNGKYPVYFLDTCTSSQ